MENENSNLEQNAKNENATIEENTASQLDSVDTTKQYGDVISPVNATDFINGQKPIKTALYVFVILSMVVQILVILSIVGYVIYAVITYTTSKSPSSINDFPTSGIWICENENFSLEINLENLENGIDVVSNMTITLTQNSQSQTLKASKTSGHGTLLVPVAPQTILHFESNDTQNENYVHIMTSRYKFEKDNFTLYDIQTSKENTCQSFQNNMNLYFTLKVE